MGSVRSNWTVVSGVLVSLLGAAGVVWREAVIAFLATPYSSGLRRLREEPRLARYPVLVIFVGVSLIILGLFRSGKFRFPAVRLPRRTLLLAVIALGMVLSIREWRYFGSPVWDGYGEFSRHFYLLLVQPGPDTLAAFRTFTRGYIHSGSPLAPFLIALLNLLFRDITLSYMVLMFLSTLGTAFLLKKTLVRFWRIPSALSLDYLILFFSHCAVMRSLLFPQTDALGMFWSTLLIYLGCAYLGERRDRCLLYSAFVVTAAALTKANGFFLLPFFPVLCFLASLREGRLRRRELLKTVLFGAVLPIAVFSLYIWRFGYLDNLLREISLRGVAGATDIRTDHNLKLFIISTLLTFQFHLRLIWKRGNLKRSGNLPPVVFVVTTILLLVLGSATFFLRRFLPLVPPLLLISSANLERIRRGDPSLFNLLAIWTIAFNGLVLWLHLYY